MSRYYPSRTAAAPLEDKVARRGEDAAALGHKKVHRPRCAPLTGFHATRRPFGGGGIRQSFCAAECRCRRGD